MVSGAKILYHGTPSQLDELHPRDDHGDPRVKPAIFASPSRTFALAYAGKKWGDRDLAQTTCGGKDARMILHEMRPGALQDIYGGQKGYLYHVPAEPFKALQGRRSSKEVVSYETVTPKKVEVIPDVFKALRQTPHVEFAPYDPSSKLTQSDIKRSVKRMLEMDPKDAAGYKKWRFEVSPPEIKKMFNEEEQAQHSWMKKNAQDYAGFLEMVKNAYKLQGHQEFQGLPIAIENEKGSVRKGIDRDGHKWRTLMRYPYGYIQGSKGKDGEGVDAYVGPDKKAPFAFVVHQRKPDGTGFDEDKVMLGFSSEEEARKAYLKQYDDPKFLGPISKVPMEKLKALVESGKKLEKISMNKAAISFLRSRKELETPGEAKEFLEPGDIMVGKVRNPGLLARMSEWSQGAPTSHAGMYVGDGRVVHSMPFKGVYNDTLNRFYTEHDFTAYRVNAGKKTRDEAAEFAKAQVGKGYSMLATLKTLFPNKDRAKNKKLREEARNAPGFICSALVAAAYPKHIFGNRPIDAVRPIDFVKSTNTAPVAHHSHEEPAE